MRIFWEANKEAHRMTDATAQTTKIAQSHILAQISSSSNHSSHVFSCDQAYMTVLPK